MAWTSLVGLGLQSYIAGRTRRLSDTATWQDDTARVQLTQLRWLLNTAANTRFGKAHHFAKIAALPTPQLLEAYRQAVPIQDIAGFRADIALMREDAAPDILWPGVVRHYAQTSGTTAGDKFIPVSDQMLKSNFRCALDIFAHARRMGVSLPHIMAGKCVFLGGSTDMETSPKGIKTGDLSAIVTPLIRWPLSEIYLPGKKIALMSDWPSKIDAIARLCLTSDVRMISGMASWGLVLLEKVLELARAQGRKADCIRDLWPNWTLFVHGGVRYTPFQPRVAKAWSGDASTDVPYRLELYPASEGFIALQDTRHDPGLRLCSDVWNFYEFIPLEEINSPAPRAFMCHEVEKGQRYVVCMSTCAGLWRYIIGDVVQFDTIPSAPDFARGGDRGHGDGPARLRIVGRHRHFVNAFGENLIVENIETAADEAARALNIEIGEFTAAPVYPTETTRAGHELVVEVPLGTLDSDLQARFADAYDASLKRQCVDYGVKRTGELGMQPPTITPVPMGTFHAWMASRGKLGGQNKVPRCANTRDYVDGVRNAAQARQV
jgi:hypothetical protein